MKATVKAYPQHNAGYLKILVDGVKPDIKNIGYNTYSHPKVKVKINVHELPEQNSKASGFNMLFTAYTTKEGKKLNVGGGVELIYKCGGSALLHGPYDGDELSLN
jgi:hypothetical protein